MRVLVTGGAGFIGSHLCEFFLGKGWEVVCMDDFVTGSPDNLVGLASRGSFTLVEHDVTEYIRLDGHLDWVLHFASPASPLDYLELPIQTLKVGALGTHNALGLTRAKGARFLLASTSEVYGDPLVHPQPEDYWGNVNPVGPRGVYDEAKRFAEAMTMAYHRSHGLDVRIVRIFNSYGPQMRPNDGRVVSNFIVQAPQRGRRRAAPAPPAGGILGQRQPGRPAGRLRRSQAVRRGHDDGVPPLPRPRRAHRSNFQFVRAADETQRRPGGEQLHRPGHPG